MHTEICSSTSVVKDVQQINNIAHPDLSFWTPSVLELVEWVLRPPQGGPPSLPEHSDAVLFLFHVFFVIYKIMVILKCIYLKKYYALLSFLFWVYALI